MEDAQAQQKRVNQLIWLTSHLFYILLYYVLKIAKLILPSLVLRLLRMMLTFCMICHSRVVKTLN